MKKTTSPILQLLVMLLFSVVMLIPATVMSAFFITSGTRGGLLVTQGITQLLTFMLPVVLVTLIYYRGEQREYYKLDFSGRKWLFALIGVVALVLLLPLIDWLTVWNDEWHWSGSWARVEEMLRKAGEQSEQLLAQFFETTSIGGLMANLLVIALIPALCEEVFFRAGIQNLLQRWFQGSRQGSQVALHASVWVTAAIFSLAHGEVFAFLPRFLMGALLGYLFVYSGSLLVNVIVHFFNNAIVVVLYYLNNTGAISFDPEAPLGIGLLLTVCCALAALFLLYTTFYHRDTKNTKNEQHSC